MKVKCKLPYFGYKEPFSIVVWKEIHNGISRQKLDGMIQGQQIQYYPV